MRTWIAFVIRNRVWVLAATAAFTLLTLFFLSSLKVIIDPDEALPQTHPYVAAANRVEALFGNKLTMVIGLHVKEGTVLDNEPLNSLERITKKLENAPGLVPGSVVSLASESTRIPVPTPAGPRFLSPKQALDSFPAARIKPLLAEDPLLSGLLVSKDLRTAQIVAEFRKIPEGFITIDTSIREILREEKSDKLEFWVGGVTAFLALLEKYSERMKTLFPLAILLIGLIHFEAFRTLQALFLPLVTALLAVIWSLGILGAFGQPIDVFNAATPILILAIAAGHAVQILKRYYEEYSHLKRRNELSPGELNRQAILDSLTKVGPVMAAACLVAALGFLSLVVFEIKSIQVFGLFTGIGVLSALVLELSFIPALRAVLPPPGEREISREAGRTVWDRIAEGYFSLVTKRRRSIFICFFLFVLLAGFFSTRVEMENSQKSYFRGEIAERKEDDRLNETLSGTNSLFYLVESEQPGGILDPAVLEGIGKTQDWLNRQEIVGKSISLVDLLKGVYQAARGGSPEFRKLPEDPRMLAPLLKEAKVPDALLDSQARVAKLQIFLKTDRTRQVESLIQNLQKLSYFPAGVKIEIGGGVAGGVALNEVMIREKILNILQIMGAVFLVSSLLFRSLLAGLLVLVPLVAAVLANFGVMGAFGIPLQIATALVSAMAVGIGADYGIYLSYRLREELSQPGEEASAIRKAFLSAGKATLFVSSAVAGGFGVLMLSPGFNVHFWMGLLIALAMLVSSFTALTLFPALVLSFRPRFIFGKAKAR